MAWNRFIGITMLALIVASVGINFILTGIKNQLPGLMH
jgi:small neutral amino acid transporter SnatA (MarC family)